MALTVITLGLSAITVNAAPWIWDNDGDGIDDRMTDVDLHGITAAYTGQDPTNGLLRFDVSVVGGLTTFGAYVRYGHHPTAADVLAANATGARVTHTYRYFDCLRVTATYNQVVALRALPGVVRIETIQALYPSLDKSVRASRARETVDDALFPAVWKHLGVDGTGTVVAFLDTGINDTLDLFNPSYPGHESLRGRCVGGGDFSLGDSALDRPDINPQDHGGEYHGTHVAGIAVGTGGPSHVYEGMAPGARFVDCKVLTDAGTGFGVLDALDWIIAKRDTFWLGPGNPGAHGIQVINLSLSGTDSSDGQDEDAVALNVASSFGILSVVAMGNDHKAGYVPSPASADSAIAVAALADLSSVRRDDDQIDTSYSNQGPRTDDQDLDHLDELRPLVAAPGTNVTSAKGDPSTNGTEYVSMNGTSMAAPHVAGLLALMKQARASLNSTQAAQILRFTSEHKGVPDDPFTGIGHPDPDWDQAWGYGEIDAYAAVLEALDPATTQIVRIQALPEAATASVRIKWLTQREIGASGFYVYHSADSLAGYSRVNATPVLPVGVPAPVADSVHYYATNRTLYSVVDTGLALGQKVYYEVSWVDARAVEHFSPVLRATLPSQAPLATVRTVYTHNYADQDLNVRIGIGADSASPEWVMALGGTSDADSVITHIGVSYLGTRQWIFHTDLYASPGTPVFPVPSITHPWFQAVHEGGFVNTSGSVDDFWVTIHDIYGTGRDSTFRTLSPSQRTIEGQTTTMWTPLAVTLGVPASKSARTELHSARPNPSRGRATIDYTLAHTGPVQLTVHDVTGRLVRVLESGMTPAGHHLASFDGRAGSGMELPSGIYWVRLITADGGAQSRRLVLVR